MVQCLVATTPSYGNVMSHLMEIIISMGNFMQNSYCMLPHVYNTNEAIPYSGFLSQGL